MKESQQMLIDDLHILPNETPDEFISRVVASKNELKLSWDDIARICNASLGWDFSESYYRKRYKNCIADNAEQYESVSDVLQKIKLEKIKLSDERIQNNAYLRSISREETLKEIALEVASKMSNTKILPVYEPHYFEDSYYEGILCLSDWHYGIEIENYLNKFNPEIARQRISKLITSVMDKCRTFNINKLTVVNLGDLISGRIHSQIRIQNRIDVITQTMEVCEILSEALTQLSSVAQIDFYSVIDNHSRVEPNKKESLNIESFARIINWYLASRLQNAQNIRIIDNEIGDDIATFNVLGHTFMGVHGDKDKQSNINDRLSTMFAVTPTVILSAHMHHFSADEQNRCVIVSNGTLMGTDEYSYELRLSSIPSQTFIVVSKDNSTEYISKINL